MMVALTAALVFWLLGFAVFIAGYVLTGKVRRAGKKLLYHAEHEKGKDDSASIAMEIEGQILDHIPGYFLHLVTAVSGSVLFVLGFVALAFYIR